MIYRRCGHHPYLLAHEVYAPAEVDFLHVGEESGVESSGVEIKLCRHHQGGSGGPEDFARVVILPGVGLHIREDASPAEGVTVAVYETARRTGILEFLGLAVTEYLGLACAAVGVRVHPFDKRVEPARGGFYVRVEQNGISVPLLRRQSQGFVVPLGKPVVFGEEHELHFGEKLFQCGHGGVGRAVVGHDDTPHGGVGVGDYRRQVFAQKPVAVPVQYYDGCRWFHLLSSVVSLSAPSGVSARSVTGRFQRLCDQSQMAGSRRIVFSRARA